MPLKRHLLSEEEKQQEFRKNKAQRARFLRSLVPVSRSAPVLRQSTSVQPSFRGLHPALSTSGLPLVHTVLLYLPVSVNVVLILESFSQFQPHLPWE